MKRKPLAILLGISLVLLSSCGDFFSPDWQTPAKEFFKEYTETSAVMKMELDGTFPKNTDAIPCLPCDDNHTVTFYLRNPQNYTLEPHYEFFDDTVDVGSDVLFEQDADDKSIVRLTFTRNFLREREDSFATKDISGRVTLYHAETGRTFDNFTVGLHANTVPPAILAPCFQLTAPQDGTYVICFYMPKVREVDAATENATNPLHFDTQQLIVNGRTYYFKSAQAFDGIYNSATQNEDGTFTVSDKNDAFSTTAPSGLAALSDNSDAFSFDSSAAPEGYTALYYVTDQPPIPDTVTYSFTVRDMEGLFQTVAISNKARQLTPPVIEVEQNTDYAADEESGFYTLRISHNGLCTDDSSCGPVTIHYTVTESSGRSVFASGTSTTLTGSADGVANVKLPQGRYTITANATKDYYIASDHSSVSGIRVKQQAVFYIRNDGDDAAEGKRTTPLATIQRAIKNFKDGIDEGFYDSDSICQINVLSDLTVPADFDFDDNDGSLINIPSACATTFIINGFDSTYTIDASQSSAQVRLILSRVTDTVRMSNLTFTGFAGVDGDELISVPEGKTLTLTDVSVTDADLDLDNDGDTGYVILSRGTLTMTGGSITGCNAARVIYVETGDVEFTGLTISDNTDSGAIQIYDNTSVTMTNCTISRNTGWDQGGALYIGSGAEVELHNVTMTQNEVTDIGGAIFMESGELTLDGCTIQRNKADGCAGGIYSDSISLSTITLKGKNLITGNTLTDETERDVYLSFGEKFMIDGALGNSRIGVYIPFDNSNRPTPGHLVAFTQDYSDANSTVLPGNVFISQNGFGITCDDSNGEAAFAVSSGTITSATDYSVSIDSTVSWAQTGRAKTVALTASATRKEHTSPETTTALYYNTADKKFYLAADRDVKAGGDNTVTWSAALYCQELKIDDITVTSAASGLTAALPALSYEDTYTLKVMATYMGITYDASFNISVSEPYAFHETPSLIDAEHVYFGDWPQTIKAADITVDESDTCVCGGYTYFRGSDGNWYARCTVKPNTSGYTYSNGNAVEQDALEYFRVEPIKWRILSTSFNHDNDNTTAGKWLLLAEEILHADVAFCTVGSSRLSGTIWNNKYEHSNVRAFLNGTSAYDLPDDWTGRGFLQTAFTETACSSINTTKVDCSTYTTKPTGAGSTYVQREESVSATSYSPLEDKVFLLSIYEASSSSIGFGAYDATGEGAGRVLTPTDWALANNNASGCWQLRSPKYSNSGLPNKHVWYVSANGSANNSTQAGTSSASYGIVPALCIDPL